jgi:tetratricopeptide (TPR) repeat protein
MSKKPVGVSTVFVILGLLFIAIIGLRTISTPEIWTHLAQGKSGAAISFLEAEGAVNTTHLYDKLAYMCWNAGGASLLVILNVVGLLAAFILLLPVAKKWGGEVCQAYALLIAGHLIFQTVDVGPQVAMMLFIALFVFIVSNITKPAILFGALIPLQILWTNMHGSFLFGPLIAGLAAIQAAQNSKGTKSRKVNNSTSSGLYGALAAALLVATVVNPYFLKLHGQVFANLSSPAPAYWSSLFIEYFQIPALKPLILFVMILGAGGLITLKKKLPVVLTTLAIIGAFLVWTSPQMSLLFAVLAFPFVVLSLNSISEYVNGSLSTVMGKNSKVLGPFTQGLFVVLFILSVIPITTNCAYVKTGSASTFGMGIEERLYPAGAEAILNHPDFPERALNLAADGGYLAFKHGRKVFIDYRPGRYDKELLNNLDLMMRGSRKAYDELYAEYRPEAMIINTLYPSAAQGLTTLLGSRLWKLAYFDGTTAILLLNKEEFAAILSDTEAQQAGLAQLEAARAEYAANVSKGCRAGNPAELIGSGKVFLALNRPAESKAIFSLLLKGNSSIPGAWLGLGTSQLLLKEFDAAQASLETATKMAPGSFLAWATYAQACKYNGDTAESQRAVEEALRIAAQSKEEQVESAPTDEVPVTNGEESITDLTVPDSR